MPNPFDLHLSAFDHVSSLTKMNLSGGLDQSLASVLHGLDALTVHGGLERIRQQTESLLGPKDYLLREAKRIASAIEDAEGRARYASALSDTLGDIERYRRMVNDANEPLSALRSVSLYEQEAARLASQSNGLLSAAGVRNYTDAFDATEQIRKQQELLTTSLGGPLASRWLASARDIAQQFASARDIVEKQAKAWAEATAFDPARLARGLGMPVLDTGSFGAIAMASGVEGLLAQLKSFGIDEATLRDVAFTVAVDEGDVEELLRDSNETDGSPCRQLTKEQIVRLWNLVFILYSVLFPLYTWWDSNQAEARVTGEIREAEERTNQKLEAMAKLMEKVVELAEQDALGEKNMVVRERVATIWGEPRQGAGAEAEVFPNQVVTLLGERGKWIHVEYYDWLAREERTGWALKKYFARAEPSERHSRGSRFASNERRPIAASASEDPPAEALNPEAGSAFGAEAERVLVQRGVSDRGSHPVLIIDHPLSKEEAKARIQAIKALAREGKL